MTGSWCRARRVFHRRTLAGALLLGPELAEPVLLTGPGADIWELLGDGIDHEQLVATLSADYDADPAEVDRDVTTLLEQLGDAGLVEPA